MSLDPVKTTGIVSDRYKSYLSTTFHFHNPEFQRQLEENLQEENFTKGPILEATSLFNQGSSINDLIEENVLSKKMRALNKEHLPPDRLLWIHQEESIRKVVIDDRNIVVATGTGSGKTECFLIPIINHLLTQLEVGKLTPGVRALLLYPMNALANDQLKRLRGLLTNLPEITYGRYTGETKEKEQVALEKYRRVNQQEPPKNELISRKEMKDEPPHILITNYAMLEYLMLRPEDHVFFNGSQAEYWKYIVLDEAHTYDGATGIEMSMLLRRLAEKIDAEKDQLQFIATSATLGGGPDSRPDVASFASRLFNSTFTNKDVILADRKELSTSNRNLENPRPQLYIDWVDTIESSDAETLLDTLHETGSQLGYSEELLCEAIEESSGNLNHFLYFILSHDKRLSKLQGLLEERPHSVNNVTENLFPSAKGNYKNILALVELAVKAKPQDESQPLLPARFHSFVRSVEGAFLRLAPTPKLYLNRVEEDIVGGEGYQVFEVASCRNCGAPYLVGELTDEEPRRLKQPGKKFFENDDELEYYMLIDEEYHETNAQFKRSNVYQICGKCGAIDRKDSLMPLCEHEEENYWTAVKADSTDGIIHTCLNCNKTNPKGSQIWRFIIGKDAIASVLATSLYEEIPRKRISHNKPTSAASTEGGGWTMNQRDFQDGTRTYVTREKKRQLLIFSDSRQDAAFFAPYLERTHDQILRRRLITRTIKNHEEKVREFEWRLKDLQSALVKEITNSGIFPGKSPQQIENEAWKWVLFEFLQGGRGLERLGVLGYSLVQPDNWSPPQKLTDDLLHLNDKQAWTLFEVLLNSLRTSAAVEFPGTISPDEDFFSAYIFPRSFREYKSSSDSRIVSWVPSENHSNVRSDYLVKLSKEEGNPFELGQTRTILKQLWDHYFKFSDNRSIWHDYVTPIPTRKEGITYKLSYKYWTIEPSFTKDSSKWYKCKECNQVTQFNVHNVCPKYRCNGQLVEIDPEEAFEDHHYRKLYFLADPAKMKVKEHTAQLSTQAASELQTRFKEGDVDVLSCSTTFELGVDVGELEAVFMRNVPPTPANYVQRAGRAGRRTDSTAFSLTFAQRKSHDLSYYKRPNDMVDGTIQPPHFDIKNEKIIRRHMYALALAKFWQQHPKRFKYVRSFFSGGKKDGLKLVKKYLETRPQELKQELYDVVPEELHNKIGIDDWSWARGFVDEEVGVLSKLAQSINTDIRQLEKVRQERFNQGKNVDYIQRAIDNIKDKYLLSTFSTHNVIPKYGFPVDVVDLEIPSVSRAASQIELSRDLRIALSEYAPGSQVVANGKVWTSRYLKKIPNRSWTKYKYYVCNNCDHYQRDLLEKNTEMNRCEKCGAPLGRHFNIFIVPEFGFIAENKPQYPGQERPEKTYTSRVHFSGESVDQQSLDFGLNRSVAMKITSAKRGKLAVINNGNGQGFYVCNTCGYAVVGRDNIPKNHNNPWGSTCNGEISQMPFALGHEFETDIVKIELTNYENQEQGFWWSFLYALLEGSSEALNIERSDLSGTLHSRGQLARPILVLYDDVPGGAGHVKRIVQNESTVNHILERTLNVVERCNCGGENKDTSCYGCLRNFRNQRYHDILSRGKVITFLRDYFM